MLCIAVGLGLPEEEPFGGSQILQQLPQPQVRVINAQIEVIPVRMIMARLWSTRILRVSFQPWELLSTSFSNRLGEGFSSQSSPWLTVKSQQQFSFSRMRRNFR